MTAATHEPSPVGPPRPTDPARAWWLLAISGLVGLAVGVLVVAYPHPSVHLLGILLGIDLLVASALQIVHGASNEAGEEGTISMLLGVLGLIAGLVVIRNPRTSLTLLVVAFAIWAIAFGAVSLGRALVVSERRWTRLLRGVVLIAAGTLIISWPDISVKTLTVLAGITMIVHGCVELAEAAVLRAMRPSGP